MEGIRGRGFSSDIALDDIKITRGGCPEKITEAGGLYGQRREDELRDPIPHTKERPQLKI